MCVLDKSGINRAESNRKVGSGRRVASVIRSLINVRDLQLKYIGVLHEIFLIHVFIYGNEIILGKEERFRIRAVLMDNLRRLLNIRMDMILNAEIRKL